MSTINYLKMIRPEAEERRRADANRADESRSARRRATPHRPICPLGSHQAAATAGPDRVTWLLLVQVVAWKSIAVLARVRAVPDCHGH